MDARGSQCRLREVSYAEVDVAPLQPLQVLRVEILGWLQPQRPANPLQEKEGGGTIVLLSLLELYFEMLLSLRRLLMFWNPWPFLQNYLSFSFNVKSGRCGSVWCSSKTLVVRYLLKQPKKSLKNKLTEFLRRGNYKRGTEVSLSLNLSHAGMILFWRFPRRGPVWLFPRPFSRVRICTCQT